MVLVGFGGVFAEAVLLAGDPNELHEKVPQAVNLNALPRRDYPRIARSAAESIESEIARQLFPDQEAFHRDENRRWELRTNHWDLPIHRVGPNTTE